MLSELPTELFENIASHLHELDDLKQFRASSRELYQNTSRLFDRRSQQHIEVSTTDAVVQLRVDLAKFLRGRLHASHTFHLAIHSAYEQGTSVGPLAIHNGHDHDTSVDPESQCPNIERLNDFFRSVFLSENVPITKIAIHTGYRAAGHNQLQLSLDVAFEPRNGCTSLQSLRELSVSCDIEENMDVWYHPTHSGLKSWIRELGNEMTNLQSTTEVYANMWRTETASLTDIAELKHETAQNLHLISVYLDHVESDVAQDGVESDNDSESDEASSEDASNEPRESDDGDEDEEDDEDEDTDIEDQSDDSSPVPSPGAYGELHRTFRCLPSRLTSLHISDTDFNFALTWKTFFHALETRSYPLREVSLTRVKAQSNIYFVLPPEPPDPQTSPIPLQLTDIIPAVETGLPGNPLLQVTPLSGAGWDWNGDLSGIEILYESLRCEHTDAAELLHAVQRTMFTVEEDWLDRED